jgi:phage tail protein X
LACWTLARTLSAQEKWVAVSRRLGRLAAISVVTAAAFGLAQVVPALPEGLLERIALIAELAVLLAVASAARKAAR